MESLLQAIAAPRPETLARPTPPLQQLMRKSEKYFMGLIPEGARNYAAFVLRILGE